MSLENGVAAGVRRIEALTGRNVFEYYRGIEETLENVSGILRAGNGDVVEKAQSKPFRLRSNP